MPLRHVSYRYEFGVALHEQGLNTLSAALRLARPELFSHATEIEVVPARPGPPPAPPHVLTLYAVANEAPAFNLYPVSSAPEMTEDTFLLRADVSFLLSDSILGTVTRLGAVLQATGKITIAERKARVEVLDFRVAELRGEHPELGGRLVDGRLDASASIERAYGLGGDDTLLARSFRAIMGYLIDLFLEDALKKTATEFPLPTLSEAVSLAGIGPIPLQAIHLRNDSLYLLCGKELDAPAHFPAGAAERTDLRVGISTEGLRRVMDALLPFPIENIDVGHDRTTLQLIGRNLQIPQILFDIAPGADALPMAVFFKGDFTIGINVEIPLLKRWLRVRIPFPVDRFSHYTGAAHFRVAVDPDDPYVRLQVRPEKDFFGPWYAFILTNYRGLFAEAFRNAARAAIRNPVVNVFCKIPIIGWFVCDTIDALAPVIGWVTGAALDAIVSSAVNTLLNTIGRSVAHFVKEEFSDLATIEQKKVRELTGLTLRSGSVLQVDDGRTGELEMRLWFQDQGIPVPPLPLPLDPVPAPEPLPPLPTPGQETLPEYGQEDFTPVLTLPRPSWTDALRQEYVVEVTAGGETKEGSAEVLFERSEEGWRIRQTIRLPGQEAPSLHWGEYDGDFRPRRAESRAALGRETVRQVVDYTEDPRRVLSSLGVDGEPSPQRTAVLPVDVPVELEDLWVYRFAHAAPDEIPSGRFARAEVSNPSSVVNWARMIPVAVAAGDDTLEWAPEGEPAQRVEVVRIEAVDEERRVTAWAARDGRGLLRMECVEEAGATVTLVRR